MIRFYLIVFLAALIRPGNAQTDGIPGHYMPGTLILKVKPAYRSACTQSAIQNDGWMRIVSSLNVTAFHQVFKNEKAPEALTNRFGRPMADLSLIYELTYSAAFPLEKVIRQLMSTGLFEYAEPHYIPTSCYSPNDPLANPSNQYHLQLINAFNAWDVNRGDSSIVIGITDTGTDPTHNDLSGNIKRNLNDPVDMIDNDADGYVDNYMGWDLGMHDNDPTWQANPHGVHVCGIAGASADNNLGGAGVGFHCKILPVKIADATGALIAAYEGIKYAADHGCAIINCSWGGNGGGQYGQDIIDYATINKGCLVVAAAGNNGNSADFFPAAYEGVFAVANTNISDALSAGSDYGYFVDVCAPGENISSTWPGNAYTMLSGTSMSSPCVAGAAGIVKNQFPSYNGLQVAERLRVTADDIYSQNPSYLNQLGSGRINLYRALTDPPGPSVVFGNRLITDHGDDIFMSGDTLFISGRFTNYLDPTTALSATLTSLSAYAAAIDNTTSLGMIGTLSYTDNAADAFRFKLTGTIPLNQTIDFKLQMQDGSYQSSAFFTVYLNTDYINITINDINTTATSKGTIGYNFTGQSQGLGFTYKGTDMLYEAGLMIGCDSTKVSDGVRGNNTNAADADFSTLSRIQKTIPAVTSDFDTDAQFNDNASAAPLPVEVHQKTFAWANAPNQKFVIWEYTLTNTHATDTLKHLYAGIFADWDIDGGTFSQNRSAYDVGTKTGYSFYTAANGKYAGIRLLTSSAGPRFYALDNVSGGNGGVDITDGFSTQEKYTCLSTQRLNAGLGGSGNDISNVMSAGPVTLVPGQTIKIAFALLGGDSLPDLLNSANQAQVAYNGSLTDVQANNENSRILIYPNPGNGPLYISMEEPEATHIQVMDLSGKVERDVTIGQSLNVIDLQGLAEGVYIVKLQNAHQALTQKIIRLK